MIIGVISDTHGNYPLMRKAVNMLRDQFLATHIIHLGDDYYDKEILEREGCAVSGVPGLWCPEYESRSVPRMRIDEYEGLRVAYAHSDDDLPPLTSDIGLCLIGHTHRFGIVAKQGVPLMNPGHLKSDNDRMRPASFGVARITAALLCLSIHDLNGETLLERSFHRA